MAVCFPSKHRLAPSESSRRSKPLRAAFAPPSRRKHHGSAVRLYTFNRFGGYDFAPLPHDPEPGPMAAFGGPGGAQIYQQRSTDGRQIADIECLGVSTSFNPSPNIEGFIRTSETCPAHASRTLHGQPFIDVRTNSVAIPYHECFQQQSMFPQSFSQSSKASARCSYISSSWL